MSSNYIELPIETDPQDLMDDFVTFMQTIVPGWEPSSGQLDVWMAQGFTMIAAESRDVMSAVPRAIFRWFGANLINFPPIDEAPAATTTAWVLRDNSGYTIPAGTQISISRTGDEVYAFETVSDRVVAPGSTTATGVQVVAVDAGAVSSGLGGAGVLASLLDPLAFVLSVTLEAQTTGGVDAETDDDYLSRLSGFLQLMTPTPILPQDFAVLSLNIAGVARAVALDGYDPNLGTSDNPRTVAVAALDATGVPVDSTHKADIKAYLESLRETGFLVYVIDPTITKIDVTYQVKALPGVEAASLANTINAALTAYLDPASWGGQSGSQSGWANTPVVRYLEVAQVINSTEGVDYITTTAGNYDLQIGIDGGGLARVDIALPGAVPLPDADTLSGTVV